MHRHPCAAYCRYRLCPVGAGRHRRAAPACGVNQRTALRQKGLDTHVLVMSATPIPRTLAMIVYGDLDLSVIDELPAGRSPIKTYLIDSSIRERAFGYIPQASQRRLSGLHHLSPPCKTRRTRDDARA